MIMSIATQACAVAVAARLIVGDAAKMCGETRDRHQEGAAAIAQSVDKKQRWAVTPDVVGHEIPAGSASSVNRLALETRPRFGEINGGKRSSGMQGAYISTSQRAVVSIAGRATWLPTIRPGSRCSIWLIVHHHL